MEARMIGPVFPISAILEAVGEPFGQLGEDNADSLAFAKQPSSG
jgi:hypothetical protein